MCYETWSIQMPENKARNSPVHQRRRGPMSGEFLRAPNIQESSVFADIRAMLFVVKAAGFFPIYEEVSRYEVAAPTKPNEFYSFFIRGVVHALTLFNLYNLLTGSSQLFYSYSDTDNVNKWIEILLCIVAYTATVLICTKNSKSFLRIVNEILKVDEEIFQRYGVTLSNNCGFSLKFIAGIIVCQWYLTILKILGVNEPITASSYIFLGFYALQNALSAIFIVFAAALLRIVKMRFSYLNLVLQGYTYGEQKKWQRRIVRVRRVGEFITGMEKFPDDSLFTYRMHNKLLRIYKGINDCCSLILVSYMGYAFYTITATTYNLFVAVTMQRSISLNILQWCLAWLAMHTSVLALLTKSCGQATNEANTTAQVLARIYGKNRDHQNIVDKFLTKSIKQEVQFTAYGFFVIDNSTLFKIFSAVTTYLVILIQFKQLEDSKIDEVKKKL